MKSTLLLLLSAAIALAEFEPSVRVDHENRTDYTCLLAATTVGPGTSAGQTLYVAFEDDSMLGFQTVRSDVMFQKSTDAGRTWLDADVLIKRGCRYAGYPDITTDSDGNVFIFYTEDSTNLSHDYCVRSGDGGTTWTSPVQVDNHTHGAIGWARAAADSAGKLFAAWTLGHVFSSVSTDKGATWSPRVRVDDDTIALECYHATSSFSRERITTL